VDAYLAVVSKREVRRYLPQPIPEEVVRHIAQAGRASGSSRNRQPWRFILITDTARLRDMAGVVYRPANLEECAAAIVIVLTNPRAQFDAGRTAQNMMLAAWALGVGTCPNTPSDEAALKERLGIPAEMSVPTVLSLGYPASGEPRPRAAADPVGKLARINRLPLDDLLFRERYGTSSTAGG